MCTGPEQVPPRCVRRVSSNRIVLFSVQLRMSSGGQVIRATQMFLKHGAGASKGVNLKAELLYGATLGVGVGLTWKVYHWNEKRKQAEYYTTLARLEQQKGAGADEE